MRWRLCDAARLLARRRRQQVRPPISWRAVNRYGFCINQLRRCQQRRDAKSRGVDRAPGDGYTTPEDANRALNERQRLRPAYDWTVQRNPEGDMSWRGPGAGHAGRGRPSPVNTNTAPMAQNADELPHEQPPVGCGARIPAQPIRRTGFVDCATTMSKPRSSRSSAASKCHGAPEGDDASNVQLYQNETMPEPLDVHPAGDSGRHLPANGSNQSRRIAARELAAIEVVWLEAHSCHRPAKLLRRAAWRAGFLDVGAISSCQNARRHQGVRHPDGLSRELTTWKSSDPQDQRITQPCAGCHALRQTRTRWRMRGKSALADSDHGLYGEKR